MAKKKATNDSWRKGDPNFWGGLKTRAQQATKRTNDALKNPLNILQKRKDL